MNQADLITCLRRVTYKDKFPCNRQGLPLLIVTHQNCELLPHSFHLYPSPLSSVLSICLFQTVTPKSGEG